MTFKGVARLTHTHAYTHTHIYIHAYIYIDTYCNVYI